MKYLHDDWLMQVSGKYKGGFLPDTLLLTLSITTGNPIICHEKLLSLQPVFPPQRFDNFPRVAIIKCNTKT